MLLEIYSRIHQCPSEIKLSSVSLGFAPQGSGLNIGRGGSGHLRVFSRGNRPPRSEEALQPAPPAPLPRADTPMAAYALHQMCSNGHMDRAVQPVLGDTSVPESFADTSVAYVGLGLSTQLRGQYQPAPW